MPRLFYPIAVQVALVLILTLALAACQSAAPAPTSTPTPPVEAALTPTPTAMPVATPTPRPATAAATPTPTARLDAAIPAATPSVSKLLAIYMVGSDLEGDGWAGTDDLNELLDGYGSLDSGVEIEVVVAFGGANKDGWRGMKFADIGQIWDDSADGEFGNEAGAEAYLYRDDDTNMGDEDSLRLFLDYLRDGYGDFDRRFLTFWDHGNSYKEFGNDSNFDDDALGMDEISGAFQRSRPGVFDLIGFDACLMASVEVAKVIEPHARYMIASEELEPGHGWLWSEVVRAYAEEDDVVEVGRRMVDNFVQDVHPDFADGKTLSLLDLGRYDDLVAALDPVAWTFGQHLDAASAYSASLISGAARARAYGEEERGDSRVSVDLRHFAELLAEDPPDAETASNLEALIDAVDSFVVHSRHDGTRPNSYGIAIDPPENDEAQYAAYKVSDAWREFQNAYGYYLQGDTDAPVIVDWEAYEDGDLVVVEDDNLAYVSFLYGFVEPVAFDDGSVDDYFKVVAEFAAEPTEITGEYFSPVWDQWWLTVEYDQDEETAWIPAVYEDSYEEEGQWYSVYTAEVDYRRADKDYTEDDPYDLGVLTLIVDEFGEVVYHDIQTYQYVYYGPDDLEGTLQFDKATYRIGLGGQLRFWQFGFNLADAAYDDWFEVGDFLTFTQEPVFAWEFLEFVDADGYLVEYEYAAWAEDASGNAAFHGPFPVG